MECPPTELDALIRTAIERKRLVELVYGNRRRILQPDDYGLHKGSLKLLAYQVAGFSSGRLPNWRWMDMRSISGLRLLDRTFPGGNRALRANTAMGSTVPASQTTGRQRQRLAEKLVLAGLEKYLTPVTDRWSSGDHRRKINARQPTVRDHKRLSKRLVLAHGAHLIVPKEQIGLNPKN